MQHVLATTMKFFKDSEGKFAVVQVPNVPLIGWFVFAVASHFITSAPWRHGLSYLSFGFLFTWAWLEITAGKSCFRRVLGLAVLVVTVYSRFK